MEERIDEETEIGKLGASATLDDGGWDTEELEIEERSEPLETMDSEEKVRLMATVADAVRAEEIMALDLRDLTIIADFFLICTGKSSIQLRAIADRIEEKLREFGERKLRIEGYQEATWILMDYGDVVVHIMAAEQRAFYNLEGFWSNAPRLELELVAEPTTLGSGFHSGG
ncbi:MAG TPA: ribosome silencing factor [Chthonomonadaceae bacterium]|nr:ribosome silencing factor [Chthonomonadaceae bacterium]